MLFSQQDLIVLVRLFNGLPLSHAVLSAQVENILQRSLPSPTFRELLLIFALDVNSILVHFLFLIVPIASFSIVDALPHVRQRETISYCAIIAVQVIVHPKEFTLQPRKGFPQHGHSKD